MMHAAGMTIGLHGCTHRSLQSLGGGGMREEILHCSQYIGNLIGRRPAWFACPFGGSGGKSEDVATMQAAMKEVGVVAAVSTEKRFVKIGGDPLALPRLDAIDLPPRQMQPMAA
jgi:peptidoglycan/xylan/chitin deacetylase (PgdA/CDA1 family)